MAGYSTGIEWEYEEKPWEITEDSDDLDGFFKIANDMIEKGQGFNIDGPLSRLSI